MTTFDPGARLVFTHGFVVSPFSTAFFATRPAPIITLGFDVFVQLVIAAMTTEPCSNCVSTGDRCSAAAGGDLLHALLQLGQRRRKRRVRLREGDAVLRTPWASQARDDRRRSSSSVSL